MRTINALIILLAIAFGSQSFAAINTDGNAVQYADLNDVEWSAGELAYQGNKMKGIIERLLWNDRHNSALKDGEKYSRILAVKANALVDLTYDRNVTEKKLQNAFGEVEILYTKFSQSYRKLMRSADYRYNYDLKGTYNALRSAFYELKGEITGE